MPTVPGQKREPLYDTTGMESPNPSSFFTVPPNASDAEFRAASEFMVEPLRKIGYDIQIGDYSQFNNEKGPLSPREGYEKVKKFVLDGFDSVTDKDTLEWEAIKPDDLESRYKHAKEKLHWMEDVKRPVGQGVEFWNDARTGADLLPTDEEIANEPEDLKQAVAEIRRIRSEPVEAIGDSYGQVGQRPEDYAQDNPSVKRWMQYREDQEKRKVVEQYDVQLQANNSLRQYNKVRPLLTEEANKLVGRMFGDQPIDDTFIKEFERLPQPQQSLVVSLNRNIKNRKERNWFRDAGASFVDMGKGVAWKTRQLYRDEFLRGTIDDEEFQKMAETRAGIAEITADRLADYGYWQQAGIGFFGTLPYMAYAAAGEGGWMMIAASAAYDFRNRIALAGGDVTSNDVVIGSLLSGALYASLEKLQLDIVAKPLRNASMRYAYAKFWTSLMTAWRASSRKSLALVAGPVSKQILKDATKETLDEFFQKLDEEAFVTFGIEGKVNLRQTMESGLQEIYDSAGVMLFTSFGGMAGRGGFDALRPGYSADVLRDAMMMYSEIVSDVQMRDDLIEKRNKGEKISGRELAALEKRINWSLHVVGELSREYLKAGTVRNAAERFQQMGLTQDQAERAAIRFRDTYRTIQREIAQGKMTKEQGDEILGERLPMVEQVRQAFGENAKITETETGIRIEGNVEGKGPFAFEIKTVAEVPLDVETEGGALGIVGRINAIEQSVGRPGNMTVEQFLDLPIEERKLMVGPTRIVIGADGKGEAQPYEMPDGKKVWGYGLQTHGNFDVVGRDGTVVTEEGLQRILGEILIDPEAAMDVVGHEFSHGFWRVLAEFGIITKEDAAKLEEQFGKAKSRKEQFDEEVAGDAMADELAKRVNPFAPTMLDSIQKKVGAVLDLIRRKKAEAKDRSILEIAADEMANLRWRGIPVAAKAKPMVNRDAAPAPVPAASPDGDSPNRQPDLIPEGGELPPAPGDWKEGSIVGLRLRDLKLPGDPDYRYGGVAEDPNSLQARARRNAIRRKARKDGVAMLSYGPSVETTAPVVDLAGNVVQGADFVLAAREAFEKGDFWRDAEAFKREARERGLTVPTADNDYVMVRRLDKETDPANVAKAMQDGKRWSVESDAIDSDYMAAVERGDTATAQRMVDEAARSAGWSPRAWFRGLDEADKMEGFEGLQWLSENPKYAGVFAGNKGKVYRVFLQSNNRLDVTTMRGERSLSSWEKWLNSKGITGFKLENWAELYGKYTFFDLLPHAGNNYIDMGLKDAIRRAGYNGIDAPRETNNGIRSGDVRVVFSPSQIKSADTITRDDAGRIIPPSERFNPKNDDIRYSVESLSSILGTTRSGEELSAVLAQYADDLGLTPFVEGLSKASDAVVAIDKARPDLGLVMDVGIAARLLLESKVNDHSIDQFLFSSQMDLPKSAIGLAKAIETLSSGDSVARLLSDYAWMARAEAGAGVADLAAWNAAKDAALTKAVATASLRPRYSVESGGIDSLGFYSQLKRVIQAKVPNRATVAQIRATIDPAKGNGVKADEIFWSGLQEFLDSKKPADMVTKEEVLAATREVVVTDVVKGTAAEGTITPEERVSLSDAGSPKFANYVLPGGENYRELLLTLPANDRYDISELKYNEKESADRAMWIIDAPGQSFQIPMNKYADVNDAIKYIAENKSRSDRPPPFRSGHFSEPNIVAHVRFNERTSADGKRTLFIEEIQSDWAQKGKKEGFSDDKEEAIGKIVEKLKADGWEAESTWLDGHKPSADPDNQGYHVHLNRGYFGPKANTEDGAYRAQAEKMLRDESNNIIPSAPYVTKTDAWVSLALKRMMRWAAENGFEQVAWTTGEQQAERYDLSEQVDRIEYWKDGDDYGIQVFETNGETVLLREDAVSADRIESLVGKDIAKRIIETASDAPQTISGDGLKVGGEGMKGFYDAIVPNTANKLFKRFGAKVENIDIVSQEGTSGETVLRNGKYKGYYTDGNWYKEHSVFKNGTLIFESGNTVEINGMAGNDGYFYWITPGNEINGETELFIGTELPFEKTVRVHALPITTAMRESVMTEGQARFSVEQTDTDAFREWFGDSKVVDKDGKPLVVYHGTRSAFAEFKTPIGGAHFGTKEQANDRIFGDGALMPVYLNLKNPVRLPDLNTWGPRSIAPALEKAGHITKDELAEIEGAGSRTPAWAKLMEILADHGIDGFVYSNEQEGKGDSYIALDPTQIKSATGNRGTFDPGNPDIRFSVDGGTARPHSGNSEAIAALAVKVLAGETVTTADAKKAIYVNGAMGLTPEQAIEHANGMATREISKSVKQALKDGQVRQALQALTLQAELDAYDLTHAVYAGASAGAMNGLRMNAAHQRDWDAARARMANNAMPRTTSELAVETGIDPIATLMSVLPAEWRGEDAPKSKKKKNGENDGEDGEQTDSGISVNTVEATPEQLAARHEKMRMLIDAAKAQVEMEREERRLRMEKKAKADAKRAEDGRGMTEAEEQAEEADDAVPPIPKALLEAHGVDLKDAAEMAALLRIWVGDWMINRSEGRLTWENVWDDIEANAVYRKTMQELLTEYAYGVVDPVDYSLPTITAMITEIPSLATADKVESRTRSILRLINASAIRQSKNKLIDETINGIDERSKPLKAEDGEPLAEDFRGKVTKEVRKAASYIKRVIQMGPLGIEHEQERLRRGLSDIEEAYETVENRDVESSAQQRSLMQKVQLLERWGGLKQKMPAEIVAGQQEIFDWLMQEQDRLHERWFKYQQTKDGYVTAMTEAVVPADKAAPQDDSDDSGITQFATSFLSTLRQEIEFILRHGDPIKRAEGMAKLENLMTQLSVATARYETMKQKYVKEHDDLVLRIFNGDRAKAKAYLKRLEDEKIADDLARSLDPGRRQGLHAGKRQMVWGQALQLYASVTQAASYGANLVAHNRQEDARMIERDMTAEDHAYIQGLRDIYEARREALSRTVYAITGLPVNRPDPLYMPVQMFIKAKEDSIGMTGTARAVNLLAETLTPRIKNGRDFDLSVNIVDMFMQRTEDTARAIGYGERGILLRDVLGSATFQEAVRRYYGKKSLQKIHRHLAQTLAGIAKNRGGLDPFFDWTRKWSTYAMLSGNLASASKQVAGLPMYAAVLDRGYAELYEAIRNWNQADADEVKASEQYQSRYGQGGFAPEVKDALAGIDQAGNIERLYRAGMIVIQRGDWGASFFVVPGLYRSKLNQLMVQPEYQADPAKAKEEAMAWAWTKLEESQQSSRTENRPEFYRGANSMAMLGWQFGSASLLQLSHEVSAYYNWKAGVKGGGGKFLRSVILNHVVIPNILSLISTAWALALGRPPDDDDPLYQTLLFNALVGPFARIFFVGAVAESAFYKLTGKYNRIGAIPALGLADRMLGKLVEVTVDAYEFEFGEVLKDVYELIKMVTPPLRMAGDAVENRLE